VSRKLHKKKEENIEKNIDLKLNELKGILFFVRVY
jgi:hypothetical protein